MKVSYFQNVPLLMLSFWGTCRWDTHEAVESQGICPVGFLGLGCTLKS